ncbi:MAG: response regulator [Saprospiraceae bacterium]|nr:response regulator [Saprospiraceae bacterium]
MLKALSEEYGFDLYGQLVLCIADVSVLGIAKTGKEALALITSLKPNIVFLDIELPDMTGFELLQQLDDIHFQTIFTTAHSDYAIKAFRFNALDYLVSPSKKVNWMKQSNELERRQIM